MTKNAFEIRSDILALAKDYMDKQTAVNAEFTKALITAGTYTLQDIATTIKTTYSMEELMKTADKMYGFVAKRDNTKE
jgi:hypothetical protein